jgi:hypothetical protein
MDSLSIYFSVSFPLPYPLQNVHLCILISLASLCVSSAMPSVICILYNIYSSVSFTAVHHLRVHVFTYIFSSPLYPLQHYSYVSSDFPCTFSCTAYTVLYSSLSFTELSKCNTCFFLYPLQHTLYSSVSFAFSIPLVPQKPLPFFNLCIPASSLVFGVPLSLLPKLD